MVKIKNLLEWTLNELDEMKAKEVKVLDVSELTTITDNMVIASGTSTRHVKAVAASLHTAAKKAGIPPIGVEGEGQGDWVLVDLGDVIVHIMIPETRDFYQLEKLWTAPESDTKTDTKA